MRQLPTCLTAAALLCLPAPALAQHGHEVGHGALSETAAEQLMSVAEATAELATPAGAEAAGYRLAFPWIPTMGEHWVHGELLSSGEFDLERPAVLMFSEVEGDDKLVGVAYGFVGDPDAPVPDGFDGDLDQWHDHVEFAPPGQTLHMLHAWLVPSNGGPFSGHNHYLAYWRAGLELPASFEEGTGQAERVKALGVALGLLTNEGLLVSQEGRGRAELLRWLEQQNPEAPARMTAARETVSALLPELHDAVADHDKDRFNSLADRAVGALDDWQATLLESVPMEGVREGMRARLEEMRAGGHAHP